LSEPLYRRRAAIDAQLQSERARPRPDSGQIERLRQQRERVNEQLRQVAHPL
jgi:hypothetical protein